MSLPAHYRRARVAKPQLADVDVEDELLVGIRGPCRRAGRRGGADAARLPAQSASSIAALRSQVRPPSMTDRAAPRQLLAQHRLSFGKSVRAVVSGLDILDGYRSAGAGP